MFKKSIIITFTALILTACGKSPDVPAGYYLQFSTEASDIRPLSLNLQDDGRLSAFTGCNNAMGSYSVDKGKLSVSQLASTMMACSPDAMALEQDFSAFLQNAPEVQFEGKTLTLTKNDTTYLFNLRPEPGEAVTKLVYIAAERKTCTGVALQQCLQIREHPEEDWQLYYGEIEGFEPEEGIAYRLRIKEYDIENPPADASSKKWVLDMVVEQEVVQPH
ncbi:META and DUF4377 domain-containing protein [Chromatiaceae bacterium AAb-1]|nr:META and DUF4377 domain-containing protein [Chromatiaceae bacterium AAb-1]